MPLKTFPARSPSAAAVFRSPTLLTGSNLHLMPNFPIRKLLVASLVVSAAWLQGCAQMPSTGPTTEGIQSAGTRQLDQATVPVVDIDENLVDQLLSRQTRASFADVFNSTSPAPRGLGAGDTVEVSIWEAPPATLFAASSLDSHALNPAGGTVLPPQMLDRQGVLRIPFAGSIQLAGLSPAAAADKIAAALNGKAHQPQVLVRVVQNTSATVTVLGEVNTSLRMPLTAGGEHLLDALALAGGFRYPADKMSVQLTRGEQLLALPLERVIREPRENVVLQAGDVVTALYQPLSFTILGASGRQQEVPFEVRGISLGQALGRAGGLMDNRSDPQGVFIFRYERQGVLDQIQHNTAHTTTLGKRTPVIYRLDLRNPKSFFAMQAFSVQHEDVIYISNAPIADLQKFLNLVFSINRQVIYTFDNLP
jgi:polysaccharide export outer membrane protein